MFNFFKVRNIINRENDEFLYGEVLTEMNNGTIHKNLWAKAMAMSDGNEAKTKSLYMQYRVQKIKDELQLIEIATKEADKIKTKKIHIEAPKVKEVDTEDFDVYAERRQREIAQALA